jgi:ectoine hydroxylase-related dioxygenase (phytanoyl-CoA dioxygenase family)
MAEVALHPLALTAIESMLKGSPEAPRCDRIELNLTQAISIGPGEGPQFLHRDEELWPHRFPFEIMANAIVAIDDFTAENGATRLIPGSHRWDRAREPAPGEAAGGANRSAVARRGVVVSYRLGWIAPAERLLLSIPPDIARRLPPRLQQLIGYQLHRPNLGWIEGRDPIEWLNGEVDQLASAGDNLTPAHEAMLGEIARQPERFAGYLT